MSQPAADDRAEAVAVEAIACAAAFAADLDDAGLLEHLEMARRGGPAVLEVRRQVPRRELAAEVTEKRNDMPSRPVRECEEHLVEVLERERVAIGHAGQLAQELIISKQGNLAPNGSAVVQRARPFSCQRVPAVTPAHRLRPN